MNLADSVLMFMLSFSKKQPVCLFGTQKYRSFCIESMNTRITCCLVNLVGAISAELDELARKRECLNHHLHK